MKAKDIRVLIETKRDRLIEISGRKIRHKTDEEEKRYKRRRDDAKKYLGELLIVMPILEKKNYEAATVNENFVATLKGRFIFETLYEGEYVKLYYHKGQDILFLILSSVKELENLKK